MNIVIFNNKYFVLKIIFFDSQLGFVSQNLADFCMYIKIT